MNKDKKLFSFPQNSFHQIFDKKYTSYELVFTSVPSCTQQASEFYLFAKIVTQFTPTIISNVQGENVIFRHISHQSS